MKGIILSSIMVALVLVAGCVTQSNKNEVQSLREIIPDLWTLTEKPLLGSGESYFINEVYSFEITSNSTCTRETRTKLHPELFNETINPSIVLSFENKWTPEKYEWFKKCEKSLGPIAARCTAYGEPTINTKSYSIFIIENKCEDETTALKDSIIDALKKFK